MGVFYHVLYRLLNGILNFYESYLRPVYKMQSTVCDMSYMKNPFMILNKVELIMGQK